MSCSKEVLLDVKHSLSFSINSTSSVVQDVGERRDNINDVDVDADADADADVTEVGGDLSTPVTS